MNRGQHEQYLFHKSEVNTKIIRAKHLGIKKFNYVFIKKLLIKNVICQNRN